MKGTFFGYMGCMPSLPDVFSMDLIVFYGIVSDQMKRYGVKILGNKLKKSTFFSHVLIISWAFPLKMIVGEWHADTSAFVQVMA